jgi:hypothetical protein
MPREKEMFPRAVFGTHAIGLSALDQNFVPTAQS